MVERKISHLFPPRLKEYAEAMVAMTTFHGEEMVDYRGKSWTDPPLGVKGAEPFNVDNHACYVPKKCVFRFQVNNDGTKFV